MNRLLPFLLVLLVLASGCRDTITGASRARPEVTRFREQMKARQFEAIFDGAHPEFQKLAPKEKVLALFSAVDRKLGALKEATEVNWNSRTNKGVTNVALVFRSQYEGGEATETFTYRISDGRAQLLGYNISSLDMLIK